ncbi:myosin-6-like [Iris pallida]|uniref:Myosin-6-like n=1 Tax=Iris pallida TaxID=29817 RepID=A0AAX6G2X8_IRIPA|nr:myosin-6-like [Iris pallida]
MPKRFLVLAPRRLRTWKEESSHHLAYWLSNVSTLLFLLQRSLTHTLTSVFGRMAQGFLSSSAYFNINDLDVVRKVEAKYPVLRFKQQLQAYVEKIYGIIRDNMKKDLTYMLSICIQV